MLLTMEGASHHARRGKNAEAFLIIRWEVHYDNMKRKDFNAKRTGDNYETYKD